MVDFLFALTEHFVLSITIPKVMRWNVYSSAVFRGGSTSLNSNFT